MSPLSNLTIIQVKIDGTALDAGIADNMSECIVDRSLGAPDMVVLRFYDPNLELFNDTTNFSFGKVLEISVVDQESSAATLLAKVELTSIEAEMTADGSSEVILRGMGKWSRLNQGRKSRTFLQVKDSDIASTVAGECGLSTDIEATTVTHAHVVQWNQTNMEFLQERARRIGHRVWADGTKLYMKKWTFPTSSVATFTFGVDLMSLRPRLKIGGLFTQAEVRGWNVAGKAAIVQQASPTSATNQGGMSSTGGASLQTAFGAAPFPVVDMSPAIAAEATAIAEGMAAGINYQHVEVEGSASPSVVIQPGDAITLASVGARLNGNYMLSAVRHTWNASGYLVEFTASGHGPPTVSSLLSGGNAPHRIYGVTVGLVTNLQDPDGLGRVKVKFPILADDLESDWVRIAAPMSGNLRGIFFLPEVNDEVLVAFEGGDPNRPYIIGFLWNGTDKPPFTASEAVASGKVKQRIIKTTSGHQMIFDDTQGAELITIKDKAGNQIDLKSASGSELVSVKAVKDMKIDVTGNLDITVTGNTTMKSTGNTAIEATGNLTAKSTGNSSYESTGTFTLKSNSTLSMSANASAELKANAMLTLSSSAIAELKGSLVKIN